MNLRLLEPLRELFKDEERQVGKILGVPEGILRRHPFPGPGLAIRILGEAKRQVVEGVISLIKLFNAGSGWRTLTCVLVYTYAYAIGYSYYRRGELEA